MSSRSSRRTRASRRSTVVAASSSAWRRGSSTWTMPGEQVGQDGRVVGDLQVARAERLVADFGLLLGLEGGCAGAARLAGLGRVVRVIVVLGADGLELDPDVEDLGRLAVARPHQLEVAHEPADRGRGQALGPRLVADLVLERRHLGDQVRLGARVDRIDREPPGRRRQQVVAAVRVAAGLADLGERPDARRGPATLRSPTSRPSRISTTPNGVAACRGSGGSARGSAPRRCGAGRTMPGQRTVCSGKSGISIGSGPRTRATTRCHRVRPESSRRPGT